MGLLILGKVINNFYYKLFKRASSDFSAMDYNIS